MLEPEPESSLGLVVQLPSAEGMVLGRVLNLRQDRGQLATPIEQKDRRLTISPARVAQKLIDGLRQSQRATPELALCNEDVSLAFADDDVGLAREVKGLARSLALV